MKSYSSTIVRSDALGAAIAADPGSFTTLTGERPTHERRRSASRPRHHAPLGRLDRRQPHHGIAGVAQVDAKPLRQLGGVGAQYGIDQGTRLALCTGARQQHGGRQRRCIATGTQIGQFDFDGHGAAIGGAGVAQTSLVTGPSVTTVDIHNGNR